MLIQNKIGFACKYVHPDQNLPKKQLEEIQRPYNSRTTTRSWLNNQSTIDAETRLWELLTHNIESYGRLIDYVSSLPEPLRMVRLSSDAFPMYTEPKWEYFWRQPDVVSYAERFLGAVGDSARASGIRLSAHPGQFVVLASDRPEVVEMSIKEFEYHVDMIRWMGYGKEFQDFKCNVHISGRNGPAGIRSIYPRLSTEARNVITFENDENSWGLDDTLSLADITPIVVDIHHHWVKTGEYIESSDDRFKRALDSWRGVTPVIHYSVSRESLLDKHPVDVKPDMHSLLTSGYSKSKLRAHSDFYWNSACNEWALSFSPYADIMCESKMKNLASIQLYESV